VTRIAPQENTNTISGIIVHGLDGRWEIRLKGKAGIARALYVTARGERVIVVRVFVKKSEKTPAREIELALDRAKELE
jgi:phage-related protein